MSAASRSSVPPAMPTSASCGPTWMSWSSRTASSSRKPNPHWLRRRIGERNMSSIDRQQGLALERFYEDNVVSLARRHGMEILDRSPDPSAASYLVARPRTRMSPSDFVLKLGDERQAAQTLDAQWDQTPLRRLGRRLL